MQHFSMTCLRTSRLSTHHLLPCIRRRATVANSIKRRRRRRPGGHHTTHSARAPLVWCQRADPRAQTLHGPPLPPSPGCPFFHPTPPTVCIRVPGEAFWLRPCTS